MPEGPDLKNHVRFSDNPKMDNSGLSVTPTSEMWLGNDKKPTKVSGPEISGGQVREAAIAAGLSYGVNITDMASLQKISKFVAGGASLQGASHDVAREYAFMKHGRSSESIFPSGY